MKPIRFAAAILVAVTGAMAGTVLEASDRTGIYARIDKVVMEPSDQAPQRIQVWGVFAIADPKDPNTYFAPARGYLYYALPSNAKLAMKEWADLKSVAGTNQIVAFGARWSNSPARVRVRQADERPESPDAYAMDIGVRKINLTDYAPVRSVIEFRP